MKAYERRLPRKLAAILYADVAGYSRLTGDDEDATHHRLSECLNRVSTTVGDHRGRVMHYAGDAVLAKFEAAIDALSCAVQIQCDLKSGTDEETEETKVQFRIGVNLGDVIEDRGDMYGDGVDVAARLQSLAIPGGVCISESVDTAVGNKLPLDYEFLGEQNVKNIERPIRAYHARLKSDAGTTLLSAYSKPKEALGKSAQKPSIAVLPFDNLSGDERWHRFADGITEDIITDLTRHPDLLVIARHSTFAYKGQSADVRQIGRDLGCTYIHEGSIQADREQIRVTSQLIDAADGHHIWANRYNRTVDDVFAVRDEVVEQIVSAIGGLQGEIVRAERARAACRPPASLQAYELYLMGYEREAEFTKESTLECIVLLERALRLDPRLARAWSVLGWAYEHCAAEGWVDDIPRAIANQRNAVLRAAELDPNDGIALQELGALRAREGDIGGATEAFEQGLRLGANHADVLVLIARYVATVLGREDEALTLVHKALRLNPKASAWYYLCFVRVAYFAREFETVIEVAKRATDFLHMHLFRLLALAQLGRSEEVDAGAIRLRKRFPDFDPESLIPDFPLVHASAIELYRDGLRKAGLIT